MWVFGYGSLLWKVDFPVKSRRAGYIKSYDRRFYQLSNDHRGTPENPGRVVTLIPSSDNDSKVFGLAYQINDEHSKEVLSQLDLRERGGYERITIKFHPTTNSPGSHHQAFPINMYLAYPDNRLYAGPADVDTIAKQIIKSSGSSGSNIDYICNLARAVCEIFPSVQDDHLFNIEHRILSLIN